MVGNAHLPRAQATYVGGLHGSSLRTQNGRLDAERASSMADEGGAAGAVTDALEQAGGHINGHLALPSRRPRWLPWLLATGGVAALLAVWLRRWAR